jgi:hypothetical protein
MHRFSVALIAGVTAIVFSHIAAAADLPRKALYVDLGSNSYVAPCISAICTAFAVNPSYTTSVTTRDHVVRVGLNYHFGGPAVANY